MIRLLLLALALWFHVEPALAASSIDTDLPVQGAPYNAAPIRDNFGAAANDIEALQRMNAGASPPGNPSTGTLWLQTPLSGTTYTLKIYLATTHSWVPVATLDSATGYWQPPAGGGAVGTIASAGTTDLGDVSQMAVTITGNQTIASFGSAVPPGQVKFLIFSGAATLVHNATYLILPGGVNVTTAAGNTMVALSLGSGRWRVGWAEQNQNGLQTVGALPTCVSARRGETRSVSDSNVSSWGDTAVAGGSNVVGVFCNGTAWTVFAK